MTNSTKLHEVVARQEVMAETLFGTGEAKYTNLMEHYEKLYTAGLVTKHHTYDSVFFIGFEGLGFKATKFYFDGLHIRVSGWLQTPAECYTEALVNL